MHVRLSLRLLPAVVVGILAAGCTAPSTDVPIDPSAPAVASDPSTTAGMQSSAPLPVEPAPATPAAPAEAPGLAIEGEGLRLFDVKTGSASPLGFGLPQAQVLASLERFRGAAEMGTNQDCGAGPVQSAKWPDGLSLVFQQDRFVGWGVDGRSPGGVSTAAGIGPGSTRAEMSDAYADVKTRQSSLGTEFDAGGMHGVLDGSAATSKITFMWAGVSCIAR